jgi:hypothetical protein
MQLRKTTNLPTPARRWQAHSVIFPKAGDKVGVKNRALSFREDG